MGARGMGACRGALPGKYSGAKNCRKTANNRNPKPCRWVRQLQEEFFQQGDQERALGLSISPLMDRTRAGVAKSQTHFFNAVARWGRQPGPNRRSSFACVAMCSAPS